jgi:hypothetical protein
VEYVKSVAKAIAGGLVALAGSLLLVVTGNETFADVTMNEWLLVIVNTGGVYGVVWRVNNHPPS